MRSARAEAGSGEHGVRVDEVHFLDHVFDSPYARGRRAPSAARLRFLRSLAEPRRLKELYRTRVWSSTVAWLMSMPESWYWLTMRCSAPFSTSGGAPPPFSFR